MSKMQTLRPTLSPYLCVCLESKDFNIREVVTILTKKAVGQQIHPTAL
jgi:hypothetical protein